MVLHTSVIAEMLTGLFYIIKKHKFRRNRELIVHLNLRRFDIEDQGMRS